MEIKKILNDILTQKDISQKELAELIKVSPGQISHYLSGDNYPRRRTLARIQKIYDELKGNLKVPPNVDAIKNGHTSQTKNNKEGEDEVES